MHTTGVLEGQVPEQRLTGSSLHICPVCSWPLHQDFNPNSSNDHARPGRSSLCAPQAALSGVTPNNETQAWTDLLSLLKLVLRWERGGNQNSKRSLQRWLEGPVGPSGTNHARFPNTTRNPTTLHQTHTTSATISRRERSEPPPCRKRANRPRLAPPWSTNLWPPTTS